MEKSAGNPEFAFAKPGEDTVKFPWRLDAAAWWIVFNRFVERLCIGTKVSDGLLWTDCCGDVSRNDDGVVLRDLKFKFY